MKGDEGRRRAMKGDGAWRGMRGRGMEGIEGIEEDGGWEMEGHGGRGM